MSSNGYQVCPLCKRIRELSEFVSITIAGREIMRKRCKTCRDKLAKRMRDWNKLPHAKESRRIYNANRSGSSEAKEKRRAYLRARYRTARGKQLQREASMRWLSTSQGKQARDLWNRRAAERGKMLAYQQKYKAKEGVMAKYVVYAQNRANRERDAGNAITPEAWQTTLKQFGHRCCYCGVHSRQAQLCMDHVLPLSKGGPHRIENIVPACKRCNSRKGTQIEFMGNLV